MSLSFLKAVLLLAFVFLLAPLNNLMAQSTEGNAAPFAVNEGDSLALVALYEATDGPNWRRRDNWLMGPVPTWRGITVEEGRVVGIRLHDNALEGIIPEELFQMAEVRYLDISSNDIFGNISNEIDKMSELRVFRAYYNNIGGCIPDKIVALQNLERFEVFGNKFECNMPVGLESMSSMRVLRIFDNKISGEIGDKIGANIEVLDISKNEIEGIISQSYFSSDSLVYFNISRNEISGSISNIKIKSNDIEYVNISHNDVDGVFPSGLLNHENIKNINIRGNRIQSVEDGTMSRSLRVIDAGDNHINSIPAFSGLQLLYVDGNQLDFASIERNLDAGIGDFRYIPQDSVGVEQSVTAQAGGPLVVTIGERVEGAHNEYQWYKDGEPLSGATQDSLHISTLAAEDAGRYTLRITNARVLDLTLHSRPSDLTVVENLSRSTGRSVTREDSLALVALCRAVGVQGQRATCFGSTGPVSSWDGVTTLNQRVIAIDLPGQGLTGTLPDSLALLTALERLDLSANALSGAVPETLAMLPALRTLRLHQNRLEALPLFPQLDTLWVHDNVLGFADIVPNVVEDRLSFIYHPQAPLAWLPVDHAREGDTLTLQPARPPDPQYAYQARWYLDETLHRVTEHHTFHLAPVSLDDAGTYRLELASPSAPGFQLESEPIHLQVEPDPIRAAEPVGIAPADGSLLMPPVVLNWQRVPEASDYRIQVSPDSLFANSVYDQWIGHTESVTLQDVALETGRRYHWRVCVRNAVTEGPCSLAQHFVTYAAEIPLQIAQSFGDPHQAENYRLVGLPGAGSTPLDATLQGEPGADGDWRLFRESGTDATETGDHLVEYDGTDAFWATPGSGFWLLSAHPWIVNEARPAVTLDAEGTYAIPLHTGWNILSNPLDTDLAWSQVEQANPDVTQPLYRFERGFAVSTTFPSARTGEAFYYYNQSEAGTLKLPYPGLAAFTARKGASAMPPATQLELTVEAGDRLLGTVYVRLHPEGEEGLDRGDALAPPAYFGQARAAFTGDHLVPSEAWPAPMGPIRLAREQRPSGRDGYVFDLHLMAPSGGSELLPLTATVNLHRWQPDRPADQVQLVDKERGAVYTLNAGQATPLSGAAAPLSLALLIGSEAYLEAARPDLTPDDAVLEAAYPNPFRETTELAYVVPADQAMHSVQVAVYNMLGQRVAVLAEGIHAAGRHVARWSARSSGGVAHHAPASGVYYVRLVMKDHVLVRPLTLLR